MHSETNVRLKHFIVSIESAEALSYEVIPLYLQKKEGSVSNSISPRRLSLITSPCSPLLSLSKHLLLHNPYELLGGQNCTVAGKSLSSGFIIVEIHSYSAHSNPSAHPGSALCAQYGTPASQL
jgi:hypothetical protein